MAGAGLGGAGQGADRPGLRGPLLLGHRDLRHPLPRLHAAADRPQPAALPRQHAADGARARRRAGPARGALPVADDQRRGGVRLLPGRDGPVPHRRRRRPRRPALRQRLRRRRLPGPDGRRDPRRDRATVGGPRLPRRRRPLPHPQRHRARRVHDGRQRQRVHEPDGAPEPRLLGGDHAPAGARATRRPRRARRRAGAPGARGGRLGAGRRGDVRPVRRAARHQPPGRQLPRARALDRSSARRPTTTPCCCTTTR